MVRAQTFKFLEIASPPLSAQTSLIASTQNKRQAKKFLKFPPKLLVKANFLDNITICKSVLHNDPHTTHQHLNQTFGEKLKLGVLKE